MLIVLQIFYYQRQMDFPLHDGYRNDAWNFPAHRLIREGELEMPQEHRQNYFYGVSAQLS
jgi:hypothetical protein